MDDIAAYVAESRREQGLPEYCTNPGVLDKVIALMGEFSPEPVLSASWAGSATGAHDSGQAISAALEAEIEGVA